MAEDASGSIPHHRMGKFRGISREIWGNSGAFWGKFLSYNDLRMRNFYICLVFGLGGCEINPMKTTTENAEIAYETFEEILAKLARKKAAEIDISSSDLEEAIKEMAEKGGCVCMDLDGDVWVSSYPREDAVCLLDEGALSDGDDAIGWAEGILEQRNFEGDLIALFERDDQTQDEARAEFWEEVGRLFDALAEGTAAEGEDFPSYSDTSSLGDTTMDNARAGLAIVLEEKEDEE